MHMYTHVAFVLSCKRIDFTTHDKYAHTRDCTGAHIQHNSHRHLASPSPQAFGGWPVARCACAIFQPPKPFSSTIENLEMSSFTLPSKENF